MTARRTLALALLPWLFVGREVRRLIAGELRRVKVRRPITFIYREAAG